jgi:type IV secretion system protein VirB4
MNVAVKSKAVAQDASMADYIPYRSFVSKTVIKTEGGEYITTLRLQGAAHESADAQDLNIWHEQLNGFLRSIASPNIALWSHIVRREFNHYPGGQFKEGFAKEFNAKYQEKMNQQKMLVNELYLTLIYRPTEANGLNKFLGRFKKPSKEALIEQQKDELDQVIDLQNTALAALDRYEPSLLTTYEHKGRLFSQLGEFLSYLVNGKWERYPLLRSEINKTLASVRPIFSPGGLIAFKDSSGVRFGAIVDIKEYPEITFPGILNELLTLPFEMTVAQSFTFLGKQTSLNRFKKQQDLMINSGDLSQTQIAQIDDALDDLTSNRLVAGIYTASALVFAKTQDELKKNMPLVRAALSDAAIKPVDEDVANAAAFFSMLPGNFKFRPRVGVQTSRNFAGFSCFHNYPIGRISGNQWGDAVMMLKTTSGSPYYFNFHKGEPGKAVDKNHRDLANTMVIGQSGGGKTVLEMSLLTMCQKFDSRDNPATFVVFDKDLGASIGCRANNGLYYPLKNGVASGLAPFQMDPTPNNILFLEKLIKRLVKRVTHPLTPSQERNISEAISGVMLLPKAHRRLANLLEFFDPTETDGLYARLHKWTSDGSLGWLFDNSRDTLIVEGKPVIGFDVTEFMDNEDTREPTLMYLFHRIEELIDGRRLIIFLDEFWKFLLDEFFEDLVQNKLKTIRKQNGFLVMFTQSPRDSLRSKISHTLIEQTATKIFLPNPAADYDDYVKGFKLTNREYQIIKELPEKSRCFLIKQGQNSVVAQLDMKGFDDELAVLSGNTATSLMVEKLVSEVGNDPAVWLPLFQTHRKGAFA